MDCEHPLEMLLYAHLTMVLFEYSIFAKSPLAEGTLIHTAEVSILKTGILTQKYKDWRTIPAKLPHMGVFPGVVTRRL